MEQKPNYYANITADVRYDNDLTPNAKLLYAEITALANEKGYCWANNDYFAKLYKVTKVSISKWINQLEQKGYITTKIIYKEGTKQILNRYITIVKDPIKEKFNTPIKEKFKDNNTSINIKNEYKEKINKKEKFLDFVYLEENEHKKLINDLGELKTNLYIDRLNNYIGQTGKKYKSHYYTIRQWIAREKDTTNKKVSDKPNWLDKNVELENDPQTEKELEELLAEYK